VQTTLGDLAGRTRHSSASASVRGEETIRVGTATGEIRGRAKAMRSSLTRNPLRAFEGGERGSDETSRKKRLLPLHDQNPLVGPPLPFAADPWGECRRTACYSSAKRKKEERNVWYPPEIVIKARKALLRLPPGRKKKKRSAPDCAAVGSSRERRRRAVVDKTRSEHSYFFGREEKRVRALLGKGERTNGPRP